MTKSTFTHSTRHYALNCLRHTILAILLGISPIANHSLAFGAERQVISQDENAGFRFAILTDIHIRVGATTPTQDLRNSVSQINQDNGIDFVLVTGDIADGGDGASLMLAKEELDKLGKPYYILEGNHDQNWSESGCMDFVKIFGYERFCFDHKGFRFIGFPTGPMMRMALGHVAPEDIEWAKEQLDANGKNGKPVFMVCHMPMQPQDVDNWYSVTDMARQYPVVAFIDGHYHRNIHAHCDGIPSIINITNLRQKGNDAGQYNVVNITADSVFVSTHPYGKPSYRWMAMELTTKHDDNSANWFPRPDFSVNSEYPHIKEAWTVQQHAGIYSSPVVWNRHIYAADNIGNIVCYDMLGHEAWRYSTGARVIGTPAIGKGVLVAGSADHCVYGIDARSGKLKWKVETGKPCVSAVTIVGNHAFVGAGDGIFRAINIKDGSVAWQTEGIKGYVETKPLVSDGKVVFGDWANTLYCLDGRNGKQLWTWQPPRKNDMHYSPAGVWPVAANGRVFICDPERAMTAIDINNGKQIWRTYQSKVRESIGLSKDRKRIYAKTMQDSIVCYSTETDQAKELWATDCKFGYEHARVMLVEKDGVCFASTKNGLIMALDGRTGKLLWKHKVGNTLINTVVPLSKDKIVFTNEDGTVGMIINEKP